MKQICTVLLLGALISFGGMNAQTPRDYAFMIKITTQKTPAPSITISWDADKLATHYQIFRRTDQAKPWGQPIVDLDPPELKFKDTEIQLGKEYEYQVIKKVIVNDTISYIAVGYALAGIEVQPALWRGKVLLLVDSAIASPLATEITRLIDDMKHEGFSVVRRYISRTEAFDGNAVKSVKAVIMQEYNKDKANLKSVFILGRIAVPYSGNLNPDGHPDHLGAWPADCYYGDVDGAWTDKTVNSVVAGRAENKNIPGDGKFDLTAFDENLSPINIELQVGRVDFYNMPAFMDSAKYATLFASELDLYKRYLEKNHAYRIGAYPNKKIGVIADNFGSYGGDMFSNSGWRNFSTLLGYDNVKAGDYFTMVADTTALWAYGCGGGSYTSCGGVGGTADFVKKPVNAVFTMLFGSYFGDWDSQDNIMRAVLASNGAALTCSWVGRPHSYYHHMGLGKTIGLSTLYSQNNSYTNTASNYFYGIDFTAQYPEGLYRYSYGTRFIHQSLLGDPTLRMNMEQGSVPKPDHIGQAIPTGGGGGPIRLDWSYSNPANEKKIDGYFVYRAETQLANFKQFTSDIQTDASLTDTTAVLGKSYTYMIRAAVLRQSATGSFYDISDSISIVATPPVGVDEQFAVVSAVECTPMPAVQFADIQFTAERNSELQLMITDLSGAAVASIGRGTYGEGKHSVRWDLMNSSGNRVSAGVYVLTISREKQTQHIKIVVAN